jgi:hypothetical protein
VVDSKQGLFRMENKVKIDLRAVEIGTIPPRLVQQWDKKHKNH